MLLFPVEGILEVILSYGQLLSLFLVFVVMEGFLAAKSETVVPGLAFIGLVFLLAVGVGFGFHDCTYFLYMLVPVVFCFIAFGVSRKTRARNIAKGAHYNEDGLIEEELKKMEQQ